MICNVFDVLYYYMLKDLQWIALNDSSHFYKSQQRLMIFNKLNSSSNAVLF